MTDDRYPGSAAERDEPVVWRYRPAPNFGERRPTQDRSREEYQLDPDGVVKGARMIDDPAGDDQRDIALTPGEAIRAFGRRS